MMLIKHVYFGENGGAAFVYHEKTHDFPRIPLKHMIYHDILVPFGSFWLLKQWYHPLALHYHSQRDFDLWTRHFDIGESRSQHLPTCVV